MLAQVYRRADIKKAANGNPGPVKMCGQNASEENGPQPPWNRHYLLSILIYVSVFRCAITGSPRQYLVHIAHCLQHAVYVGGSRRAGPHHCLAAGIDTQVRNLPLGQSAGDGCQWQRGRAVGPRKTRAREARFTFADQPFYQDNLVFCKLAGSDASWDGSYASVKGK